MHAETAASEQSQRLKWWRDAKFGLFIHWGVYSQLAGVWNGKQIHGIGEQIMRFAHIPVKAYETLPHKFNPVQFNAEAWVKLAKKAGMKYIVITAKHHDGFAMYDSKSSTYDIVDATPFARDPMKDLAAACQKHGIKLCFYYSQYQDWHHPHGAVNPPIWDGPAKHERDFSVYMKEKGEPQLRELLTQYGPIGLIWFDTPGDITEEQSQAFVDIVRELQPDCLVNGRIGHDQGDYREFGDNEIPSRPIEAFDWETPATINDTWGYKKNDNNWKSPKTLIQLLIDITSKGGNYLLNVGPTGEGIIPQPSIDILTEMGEWLAVNDEAIYGTSASPFPYEFAWGAMTTKPGKLFLHLYEWPQVDFVLYGLKSRVKRAYCLADPNQEALQFQQENDTSDHHHVLRLNLPKQSPDALVSVIVLDLADELVVDTSTIQQPDGHVMLDAHLAKIHNDKDGIRLKIANNGVIENWLHEEDWLSWDFKVVAPGTFDIEMITMTEKHLQGWEGGHVFELAVDGQILDFKVADHGRQRPRHLFYWQYVMTNCGRITFSEPGNYTLTLKPKDIRTAMGLGPKLKSICLKSI